MSNENLPPKEGEQLGDGSNGEERARSRRREEECKQTREGGGMIERVRRYRQLLGIGLTPGILR